MRLALFDLDNTLIAGDSDHSWGEFLVEHNKVDAQAYRQRNDDFYAAYQRGELNILDYLNFAVQPLTQFSNKELSALHQQFMQEKIQPIRLKKAEQLLAQHRAQGDKIVIITATNRFITAPIATMLGVDHLLATELITDNGRYTGRILGEPCYQAGKVIYFERWLRETGHQNQDSFFYTDSINDLALMEQVDNPVAVDPDPKLQKLAEERGWPVMTLRD